MDKSMRRANAALADAREFADWILNKPKPKPKPEPEPKTLPVIEPVKVQTKPKGMRVESAEIKKLEKGHFFVVVTCGGQRHEIQKRFKSTTKAQEWISTHEYIEVR